MLKIYVFFFNLMCILGSVQLFSTPGTVVCQAPLSVEFSRQEYWSGLPFSSLGNVSHKYSFKCGLHTKA